MSDDKKSLKIKTFSNITSTARAFIRFLIYYMTEKITIAGELICTEVKINHKLACSQPITMK